MLSWNINTEYGLVNGASGAVKEIYYRPSRTPPSLPDFVIIDFGRTYKGPKYFETPHGKESRDSWVINWSVPSSNSNLLDVDYSRTMLPIKLSHAWTIWKAQG